MINIKTTELIDVHEDSTDLHLTDKLYKACIQSLQREKKSNNSSNVGIAKYFQGILTKSTVSRL